MRILVADDSPLSAKVLVSIVTKAGHECTVVADGESAWSVASGRDPPRIMFLDWVMPGIDGLELCRRVRALKLDNYIYIVIVSSRAKQRDIALGYQSGADDFITKPFRAEELLSKLGVAERVIEAQTPQVSFERALIAACESGGGDLLVRSGSVIGRIMIYHGKVAWAHISNEPGSLRAMLASEPSITKEEINAVLEECYEAGRNFADVLVDWGLLDAEVLRAHMRQWIGAKCGSISKLESPTIIFSPEEREYSGGFLLDICEVLPESCRHSPPPISRIPLVRGVSPAVMSRASQREIDANLDRVIELDGVVAVTLFDGNTGQTLGARGVATDLDFAWHNLRMVASAESQDRVEDIIVTTQHHLHVLRLYSRNPLRLLFVTTERAGVQLGMLRLNLGDCTPQPTGPTLRSEGPQLGP